MVSVKNSVKLPNIIGRDRVISRRSDGVSVVACGRRISLNLVCPVSRHFDVVVVIVIGIDQTVPVGIIPSAPCAIGMKERYVIVRSAGNPVLAQMRFITHILQSGAGIIVFIIGPVAGRYVTSKNGSIDGVS